jgi:dTDP-3-amino-3,4,6-trideoxy-alpha-D-glucose transaminase
VKTGATPVFADCDASGLIDLEECRRILSARPEIRYFVPVHLFGHSLDVAEIGYLRDRFELSVVEDCAQSIGARHAGLRCGTAGQTAATSFYPTKNLGALGDGGAILTSSPELERKLRQLRDYGQTCKYRHDILGYNSRLDEMQAAILQRVFLPRLGKWTGARRRIAQAYLDGIHSRSITLPPKPGGSESVWHLFPVIVEVSRKVEAIAYFRDRGITVGEHYPQALIEQLALAPVLNRSRGSACERSKLFCHGEISLPIHAFLRDTEIQQVIDACNDWK